jgi:hypothetical protein
MKCGSLSITLLCLLTALLTGGCRSMKKNQTGMAKGAKGNRQERLLIYESSGASPLLDSLLKQDSDLYEKVCRHPDAFRLQIIYTQIDRNADGSPRFTHHRFPANAPSYYYPASVVKFPVSLLALEEMNRLAGQGINRNTPLKHDKLEDISEAEDRDSSTANGLPSVAGYIKKIMLVSDNDAYNRLYELLGPAMINNRLSELGFGETQIIHRLSRVLDERQNRTTNAVRFCDQSGNMLMRLPERYNSNSYPKRNDQIGKAFYQGDSLVSEPMDFSRKNRLPLDELHEMLLRTLFPEAYPAEKRFRLTDEDRRFLLRCMSQWPTESRHPDYSSDSSIYPAYCKFLLYGAEKGIPDSDIRIFNKVGDAYGQLTDAAYIVDFKQGVEFLLSATIYCNADEVLNDDRYDYETVGFPFLKQLGRRVLEYERKRVREIPTRLDGMRMDYSE